MVFATGLKSRTDLTSGPKALDLGEAVMGVHQTMINPQPPADLREPSGILARRGCLIRFYFLGPVVQYADRLALAGRQAPGLNQFHPGADQDFIA